MNMSRIIIVVAALVAAGIAGLVARSLFGEQAPAEAAAPVTKVQILVTAREIEAGSKLTSADLKWVPWPKDAMDATYIAQDAQPGAIEELERAAIARVTLVTGQPVTVKNVVTAEGGGFMAAMLTPGKRAFGIEVNEERGAGGFILPNDRVDVIMTRKAGQDGAGQAQYQSVTVLRDIRVLAVNQTAGDENSEKAIVPKTVTIEVTEKEAEALALSDAMGDLSLTLRSLTQPEGGSGPANDVDASNRPGAGGVAVLRYGMPPRVSSSSNE